MPKPPPPPAKASKDSMCSLLASRQAAKPSSRVGNTSGGVKNFGSTMTNARISLCLLVSLPFPTGMMPPASAPCELRRITLPRTPLNKHDLTAVMGGHMLFFDKNEEALRERGHVSDLGHSSGRHRHRHRRHLGRAARQAPSATHRTQPGSDRTQPGRAERALAPQPRGGSAYQDARDVRKPALLE